jgi:hypothetical protein
MALINKTGITTGGTVQAEHVTRAIDALSGGSTDSISATGSFSGSLRGSVALTGNSTIGTINVVSDGASFTYDIESKLNLNAMGKGIGFALPLQVPNGPTTGSMYFDAVTPALWIYDGTTWLGYTNTLP